MSDEQTRAFAAWKEGRSVTSLQDIWILGGNGKPERRRVRIGLVDNKYAELVSQEKLTKDERVIVRSRFVAEGEPQ